MATPPDPTIDLGWGTWNGAIHDYLHRNAKKHPSKPCVIETSPRREFTYQHIDEGSNVLAHCLVDSGIKRGDRVMIYAFRNVDLVIAIMGTLKSGATFSVIDPAYPPDRQIIYLDVARPRGLVVIGKAKGGGLSDTVTTWIKENLHLKVTVPNLRVNDDGSVSGGPVESGADAFDDVQAKKAHLPGVVLGPDSVPTLSFTSGSEGRPKGVLGRHFSLVHYQSWMAERFGMSENDRFTMLSGIAHDPIQRDIFTPLFLGAQLIVPSPEDIEHERLAEWMREHETTVTHLTPAMGQILVGGATAQMPALKNAYFVGDILIKRDVRRLQELAPHVRAINMFGTTETQRAVSYYMIPSITESPTFLDKIGDRIPAGRGMNNVQLLVVDRDNRQRICGPGEQGEIYVRAAGLAEGYLGLDSVTKEKFLESWFVPADHWAKQDAASVVNGEAKQPWREFYKGPRDRLYRSGDLGHYNSSGDVECTGRIDSQVKIRGFRFELGEVDAHLARHALVRENVTLLRRDANEEHTLVSYVVPEMTRWADWLLQHRKQTGSDDEDDAEANGADEKTLVSMLRRFRAFREELRAYLKTKVPEYAVPGVVVALDRMPLNPNGKVDKPALPFPTKGELAAALPTHRRADPSARTPTETTVAELWGSLLGVEANTIGADDAFVELGGHSVLASRMLVGLRRRFGAPLDVSVLTIAEHPTLRAFAAELDRARDPHGRILFGPNARDPSSSRPQGPRYAQDADALIANELPKSFSSATLNPRGKLTVLLTGATGFLGAYILANLLARPNIAKIIAHVRAPNVQEATARVRLTMEAYGLWQEAFVPRLECVHGDLSAPRLGLDEATWQRLAHETDMVLANGARVHWIASYSELRAANVTSLMTLLQLCAADSAKPKHLTFVSSTAALDTPHYAALSDTLLAAGAAGVPEGDVLEGARTGLPTGYAQTKWAGEHIVRAAGRRGLSGAVFRPGYVLGATDSGASITDDFLVRLLKGCVQVGMAPSIASGINAIPVDSCAAAAVAVSLFPPQRGADGHAGTAGVIAHPRPSFTAFLDALAACGWGVRSVAYEEWREAVAEAMTRDDGDAEEHALLPLAHLTLGDLPTSTKSPAQDDSNTRIALAADTGRADWGVPGGRLTVAPPTVAKYLAYLVQIGFMPKPEKAGLLPDVKVEQSQREALGKITGRGAL